MASFTARYGESKAAAAQRAARYGIGSRGPNLGGSSSSKYYNKSSSNNVNRGGGSNSVSSLAAQYQKAMDDANAKNEERYGTILQGYKDQEAEARSTLEGLGTQESADIASQYAGMQSQVGQDMVGRGLTGTTIAPTMRSGVKRQEVDAQGRLASRLKRERLNVLPNLQSQRLNFMERREDIQPDYNQLIQLAQMQGNAQGGAGGGGGSFSIGGRNKPRKIKRGDWTGDNDLRGGLTAAERARNAANLQQSRNKRIGGYDVQGDTGSGSLQAYLKWYKNQNL